MFRIARVQTLSAGYRINHTNTNTLRPHPPTGEFFPPPLDGDPEQFENRELLAKSTWKASWRQGSFLKTQTSNRHVISIEFVIFVIAALAGTQVGKIMYKLDGSDPFNHLEAQLVLASQP